MEKSELLQEILTWPDWKLNALMLDKTDLELRKIIEERRMTYKRIDDEVHES